MALRARKFATIYEIDVHLQGGLIGGQDVDGQGGINGVWDLVGKTLIFIQPSAATVTFVAGANAGRLLFKEIKSQIEAAIAAVRVEIYQKKLVLREATPLNGITLNKTGTANTQLGFDITNNPTNKIYSPLGGAPPNLQTAYQTSDNMHVLITWE